MNKWYMVSYSTQWIMCTINALNVVKETPKTLTTKSGYTCYKDTTSHKCFKDIRVAAKFGNDFLHQLGELLHTEQMSFNDKVEKLLES